MKKQIAACVLAIAMAFTMLPTSAFASAEDALIPTAETTGEASNAANPSAAETDSSTNGNPAPSATEEEPSQEENAAETGSTNGNPAPSTTEDEPSQEENAAETGSSTNGNPAPSATEEEPSQEEKAAETSSSTNESTVPPPTHTLNESSDEETSIAPFAETTYEVSDNDELGTALQNIANSADTEATIVLKADVNAPTFGGIDGKKVVFTSEAGNCYSIQMANTLTGDITLDAVKFDGSLIYANGHTFETTGNFQGYPGSATLYGGGPEGQDVAGDTNLILRGKASYSWVYGGGCNSNVGGSTYILVDDKNTSTGNLTGGGESTNTNPTAAPVGTVGGDTHVTIQKGLSGYLVGGGRNHGDQSLKENARVYGDTYVTAGEADATELQAWIGTAMASVAGSFSSTVKNTHFLVLNGVCSYKSDDDIFHVLGTGEIYGAGMLDIVRGTTNVEVRADNAVGSRIVDVYGGHYADATTLTGEVSIRNEDNEPYAVHIIYDNVPENEYIYEPNHECDIYALGKVTPTIPVNGNVLVEVKHGNLRQVVLDSYDNDCTVNGDATVRITGGRVARFEGNKAHATTGTKNTAIYDGCGTAAAPQETGYLYNFEQVTLKNGAQVSIDADPTLFPALSGLSAVQNPFYSVNNLEIKENSALTTRNSNTLIKRNVTMDHGMWHAKGFLWVYEQTKSKDSHLYFDNFFVLAQNHKSDSDPTLYTAWDSQNDELVALKSGYSGRIYGNANLNRSDVTFLCPTTVSGNWTSGNSILRLPTVATGANYPTDSIPLEISGLSTGTTTVNTVEPADWNTLKKPALGDNYILSKKNTASPAQDVFVLGNADAVEDGWFLKRMADAGGTDDYYMWQVASGIRVVFDKNGGDTEASPRVMIQDKIEGAVNHFDLPTTNPTRTGYLFNGWNTKADGTGDAFTATTDVKNNMTVYAQWQPVSGTENGSNSGSTGGNSGSTGSSSGNRSAPAAKAEQGSQSVSHAVSDAAASTSPKTGDASALSLWAAVMAVSILGLAGICMAAKIHHRSKK